MPNLINSSALVIYSDSDANNNPYLRHVDWRRNVPVTTVSNPLSERYTIMPGASQTVFSGVRSTGIDNTTTFSLALNSYNSSIYRIANTSGTAPNFRTPKFQSVPNTVAIAINNNATATFTSTGAADFSGVVAGDILFIPSALTGDTTGPFNIQNSGYWVILSKSGSAPTFTLTMTRLPGVGFSGVAEAGIVVTDTLQMQIFSSAGVQVGDTLEIAGGFSPVSFGAYEITAVTAEWIEFTSTNSLPLQTGIVPNVSGMVIYSSAKTYLRIEADQEIVVRLNGSTDNTNRISPRIVGNLNQGFGWIEKWGTVWSLEIINRSVTAPVNVMIISAE